MFEPGPLLELVTNSFGLAVIGTDSQKYVRLWSESAERMLGWTAAEMVGRRLPRELTEMTARGANPLETELQFDVHTKNGAEIGVDARVIPVRDVCNEQQPGEVWILRDVTLQLRQEEAARIGRRFERLLDAAPDAILEVDESGTIVLANAIAEKTFGYSRTELIGLSVDTLLPGHLRGHHKMHRESYRAHPRTRVMGSGLKLEAMRRNGELFPVEISLSPGNSEDGIHVTAIIRDISERRAAEQLMSEARERFAQELALKNDELQQRNLEVERSNQLKSEFLASMSHELRTPLHTIIGFSELLSEQLRERVTEKEQRFLDHILSDSLHLLELINDILDLSKIESGRLALKLEVFELWTVLEEALRSIGPRAEQKSIELGHDPPNGVHLFADRVRVKEIFLNLLSNAVKFTPEGGRVYVGLGKPDEGTGLCCVTVSDSGIGIPREEHEAIFDKFYQTGATTRGVREGTGLGLAITRHLVEQHGGLIWVESAPGQGSRFSFTIPVAQASRAAQGQR